MTQLHQATEELLPEDPYFLVDNPLFDLDSWKDFKKTEKQTLDIDFSKLCFEFKEQARHLARSLCNNHGPLTAAVYGPWGSGKTTLLNLISFFLWEDNQLKNHKNIVVKFNAWLYENEKIILIPLIGHIIKAIHEHDRYTELKDLTKALLTTAFGLAGNLKLDIPFIQSIPIIGPLLSPGKLEISKLISEFSKNIKRQNGDNFLEKSIHYSSHRELKKATENLKGCRIHIVIDDLDRCMPNKAIALLEGIKSILSHKHISFLIGLNKDILNEYIRKKYRDEFGLRQFSVERYLDKIIQVFYIIRSHDPNDVKQYLAQKIDSIPNPEIKLLIQKHRELRSFLQISSLGNPRALIRLINAVIVKSQHEIDDDQFKRHVFECGLKSLSPELFSELKEHAISRDYIGFVLSNTDQLNDFISTFAEPERTEAILRLLNCDGEYSQKWLAEIESD